MCQSTFSDIVKEIAVHMLFTLLFPHIIKA